MIAAMGLVSNSSVAVVASMLVSPLMGPILGIAFGFSRWKDSRKATIVHDWHLLRKSLLSEIIGIGVCVFPVSPVSPLVPLRVHHRWVRKPSRIAYPREYLAWLADGGNGESWRRLQSDYRVFDRAALGSRRCSRDFWAKHVVASGRCDLSVAAPAVCERRASVGVFVLWMDAGQVPRGSEMARFGVSWVDQLLLVLGEYCVGRRRKGSMIGRLSWWECWCSRLKSSWKYRISLKSGLKTLETWEKSWTKRERWEREWEMMIRTQNWGIAIRIRRPLISGLWRLLRVTQYGSRRELIG